MVYDKNGENMQEYKELNKCLCCDNKDLRLILDFKYQPLANNSLNNMEEAEKVYPLKLNFCNSCTHLQLTHAVNPDLMFKKYLYVTGTSKTMRDYLKWFVDYTLENLNNYSEINVMDIACNDGTLLDIYKNNYGVNTYGIDPSENLYEINSVNHSVDMEYLNNTHAEKYKSKFDIIVAANVMAHNDYPLDFLKICKEMVKNDGRIYIQNSQADMTKNNEFDTIYHEHLSFYSINSFKTLARRAGLILVDVVTVPIHGNSHIFVLSTDKDMNAIETNKVDSLPLNDEVIDNYAIKCYELINNLHFGLLKLKKDGYKIVGYGSAAKGNTLINASGIKLDYIVDDNPLKQGLFTPGARIPIVHPETLTKENEKLCIVPLAWNYFEEIKNNCLRYTNIEDLIFVKYFPEFKVIEDSE
jgi:2-polyprenyl-3-methyl-5-hydroxy-6-metoxy-1,4-benzoquinol methylase